MAKLSKAWYLNLLFFVSTGSNPVGVLQLFSNFFPNFQGKLWLSAKKRKLKLFSISLLRLQRNVFHWSQPRHSTASLMQIWTQKDTFHEILAKKTEFSDARKSWIKKILLHAKNQLSSSKNGHFRTNFIFRQNLDFSMGVPATVKCLILGLASNFDNHLLASIPSENI